MDAISFVLGVKSRHLRSHKLGDLVFRTDGSHARRRASVKLVYRLDDGEIDGAEVNTDASKHHERERLCSSWAGLS